MRHRKWNSDAGKMRTVGLFVVCCLLKLSQASIIDVFEKTNGHEPRVAIECGRVPFHIDLQTGAWVADPDGISKCDHNKHRVKKYCQKMYPKLNISNIVENNEKVEIPNWCQPGRKECTEKIAVTPYRCLVNEYEADALMVPNGCKFDHIHDSKICMGHDKWAKKAEDQCRIKYEMKLKDYGILLSCDVDVFTGVEFVCCPNKSMRMKTISSRIKKLKKERKEKNREREMEEAHKQAFLEAVRKFMGHMPMATKGCDRSTYIKKQTELEDAHRQQIAAVVNEWDGTEKRYLQLKAKDPAAAEEKMKRTLEVFRQTLAALEKESKEQKSRLRAEHAECINTQISKEKRDSMIAYISAIQEEPVDADVILTSVRNFIQVCEHDRVHSLRHFEHVRNRNPDKADSLRGELLQHLKDLNKVVNESMSLLNYLPDIAQQFGLNGQIGGAILKPRLALPVEQVHEHEEATHVLNHAENKFYKHKIEDDDDDDDIDDDDDDDIDDDDDDDFIDTTDKPVVIKPVKTTTKSSHKTKIPIEPEPVSKQVEKIPDIVEEHVREPEIDDRETGETFERLDGDIKAIKSEIEASQRSPFAFTVIMGLSGGVLVVMLFVIIAMVMRRRRFQQSRVIVTENDDERDHLVEMQRNGFENPTYKFFYY